MERWKQGALEKAFRQRILSFNEEFIILSRHRPDAPETRPGKYRWANIPLVSTIWSVTRSKSPQPSSDALSVCERPSSNARPRCNNRCRATGTPVFASTLDVMKESTDGAVLDVLNVCSPFSSVCTMISISESLMMHRNAGTGRAGHEFSMCQSKRSSSAAADQALYASSPPMRSDGCRRNAQSRFDPYN